MISFKRAIIGLIILVAFWAILQPINYCYWLYREYWNPTSLDSDIDKYMDKFSSDALVREINTPSITIINPYKQSALRILMARKDDRMAPFLIRKMRSRNVKTRIAAMNLLGQTGDSRAIEPLMKVVKKTKFDYSINYSYYDRDIPNNVLEHVEALKALSRIGYEPVYDYVLGVVNSERFKLEAIQMLEDLKNPKAIPLLKQLAIEDFDNNVRIWAKRAIKRIEYAHPRLSLEN